MNKHQSKFALFLFFMVFFSLFMSKPLLPDSPIQWRIGEELTYKVKWSFLRLGTLRVQLVDTIKIDTQPVFHAQISIDSNPLLFFVNYHSIFHSYFDKDLNIYLFHYHEKENGVTYRAEYRFNYKDSLVYIGLTDTTDTLNTIRREMAFHHQVLDGSSLLYYAREHAWKTTTDTVYYLTDEAQDQAIIHFYGLDQKIKIKALDKSVPCYYLEGIIRDKGVAGLSGSFQGWFHTHPYRPPLKAKLKVFIGYVTVELEDWIGIDL